MNSDETSPTHQDRLRRTLVAVEQLSSASTAWDGLAERQIVSSLADILLGTAAIDVVYAVLPESSESVSFEVTRQSERLSEIPLNELRAVADAHQSSGRVESSTSTANGLSLLVNQIACDHGNGFLITGSADTGFPRDEDVLILKVAANQAAIAIRDRRGRAESDDIHTRLASILTASEIGTWVFDIVKNQVRADANLASMFGVTAEERQGGELKAYTKAIHRDDQERVGIAIEEAIALGDTFESEYRIDVPGKSMRWVVARGKIERDPTGTAIQMPGVVVDVTRRRLAEKELRAIQEQRKLALDSAELGAFHIDPATDVMVADERFNLIFTGEVDSLTYEQAFSMLHADDLSRVRLAVAEATDPENPKPYAEEYRIIRPDGTVRWVLGKGRANFEGGGDERRLTSFDGTVADITERKNLENDLRRLAADLSDSDKRKDEFLATLAHELRNPLAPLRNGLQILKLSSDASTVAEAREMMERQVFQLVRLIDDLMDVSRMTRGKIELKRQHVSLISVLNSAVETSRPLIEQMQQTLTVTHSRSAVTLDADPTRIAQVFLNLLNNAAKYSEPGGQINVTSMLDGDVVTVIVKDSGVGIAENQLPYLFDMFSQVDHSLEKSQGGLGIGLMLVKQLVEMHGGMVEASSEGLGKGAQFTVKLPVVSEGTTTRPTVVNTGDGTPLSLKVLIADDSRDGANSLAMMLRIMGNEVLVVFDGEAALNATQAFQPDVILLDIGMPLLNGNEACRLIKEQQLASQPVIIAQTGWGQDEDRERTRESGFDHHLTKPIDILALSKLLQGIQERRQ